MALHEVDSRLQPDAAAFVALPRSEYEALMRPWDLPVIPKPGAYDLRRQDGAAQSAGDTER